MIKPEEIEALKRERHETIERVNQLTDEIEQITKEILKNGKENE